MFFEFFCYAYPLVKAFLFFTFLNFFHDDKIIRNIFDNFIIMKKLSKMFLIAFVLANSGCKNKCSDYDLASPYKTLSINYQKKNLNRPYFPSLSRDYILPDELINLRVIDEDKKDYNVSFPLRNDVYQVQIDSYLTSFKLVEIQPLKKTFFIRQI